MRARPHVLTTILGTLTLAVLLLAPTAAAAASGLPASVAMEPASAGPGSVVEVTGIDFPADQLLEVKLDGAGSDRDLAVLIADENGYFRAFVTLPEDVPAGAWVLRAVSLDGSSATHAFDAAAAAVVDASIALMDDAEAGLSGSRGNTSTDILVMLILAVLMGALGGAAAYAWREVRGSHRSLAWERVTIRSGRRRAPPAMLRGGRDCPAARTDRPLRASGRRSPSRPGSAAAVASAE